MSTMSLNADLFRELSYIADDEESMRKVLSYIRKVVAQLRKAIACAPSVVAEEAVAYHPMTKAELIADLNEMCEEVKLIRAGKLKGQSWEDFKREVYIPTKN